MLKELVISMRPKQWYKNLVLFIGIIFSSNFLSIHMWLDVFSGFVIFCMLSGSEYIINDVLDLNKDKMHPKKCKRPIASGMLKASHALALASILIFISFYGAYIINPQFLAASIAYFLLILSYSKFLKHIIIVDLLVISTGFVIRAIAGCLAIKVLISPWLIICAFLLALFLALGKRRHELVLLGDDAKNHRKILEDYSMEMLDQMTTITAGTLIISYSLYTFLADNYYMMVTIPLVIYGIFRYLFLIHAKNLGGEPEMLFKDIGILLSIALWSALVVAISYSDIAVQLGGGS